MKSSLRRTRSIAILLVACMLMAIGLTLAPMRTARATEDIRKVTEADLREGRINSTNWMSGLSGELYLHQINIPGSHDSGMRDAVVRFESGPGSGFTKYANTQTLGIDEQLQAGVRLFDLRVTDLYPVNNDDGKAPLWICHGPNAWGRVASFTFYSKLPSDKIKPGKSKYLTFDTVLQYYADFLREHPTETLVVQVVHETGSTDLIYQRANAMLKKWATTINPSTGKSYIYKEPYSGNSWAVNSMPKLKDVRGQMVIASGYAKNLGFGMEADVGGKWTRSSHCANVRMAYENHYEVDNKDKLDYIMAFYNGGKVDGASMSAQKGEVSRVLPANEYALTEHLRFVYTSTNRVKKIGWGNKAIAEYVNPRVFTNSDALMNTRGYLYGWVSADYTNAAIAKTVWLNNYPEGGVEYATISFEPPQGSGLSPKRYSVQAGTGIRLPKDIFPSATPQERTFADWECNGALYPPGMLLTAKGDMKLTPRYRMTWAHLQHAINNAPKGTKTHINLACDITAARTDSALEIPEGADIEINLNGHTIDRAATAYTKYSDAFRVYGKLKLDGTGTVTRGRGYTGGGIYIGKTGFVELGNVRVTGNTAMISGAGIFAEPRESAQGPVAALKVNVGTRIEGNTLDKRGDLSANGDPSNVRLGTNCLIQGVEYMASGTDACVLGISATEEPTKWKSVPITTAQLDERYIGYVMSHLRSEGKGLTLAFDSTNRQVVFASSHTVTFKYGVGSWEERKIIPPFGRAERPEAPSKTGYVFDDWYPAQGQPGSSSPYDFDAIVTQDLVLEAHWTKRRLTVSFDLDDGGVARRTEVEYGEKATRPADPTRVGFEFKGWTQKLQSYAPWDLGRRGIAYNFDEPVVRDVSLKANWAPIQCTVTFTDGSEVKGTQTVSYGGKATPLSPGLTRTDFVFDGWYSAELKGKYDFNAQVKRDLTLSAMWKLDPNKHHTVIFDANGGLWDSRNGQQSVGHGKPVARPATNPARDGYTFAGWKLGNSSYDFATPVTSDMRLTAQWVKQVNWNVTFDAHAGRGVSPKAQTVVDGGLATEPAATLAGYTLDGWYTSAARTDNTKYDFSTPVHNNMLLHARWAWASSNYTVRFDSAGGTAVDSQSVPRGKQVTKPGNPTRDGYAFAGWYSGDVPYDFASAVTSDRTLVARWTKLQTWTVSFESNNGASVAAQTVAEGGKAERPADPTRNGYTFGGWYANAACTGSPYEFDKETVTTNTTLYAKWTPKNHTVTFDGNGAGTENVPSALTVAHGTPVVEPESRPARTGFVFICWTLQNGTTYDFDAPVTTDLALKAYWAEEVADTHVVAFDSEGGTSVAAQSVAGSGKAERPTDPTRDGYTFDGWYANATCTGNPYDFDAAVTNYLVLHAKWIPVAHAVTFEGNGDNVQDVPSAQTMTHGARIAEPENDPVREGHIFMAWYANGSPYDFDVPVTTDLTLTAQWREEPQTWVVAFDSDGGTEVSAQVVLSGEKATQPADPTRDGYTFTGWYADAEYTGSPYVFGATPVSENMVLYAKWTPANHSVTFDGNGEGVVNVPAPASVAHGQQVSWPDVDPTRDGYAFAGWTLDGDDASYDFDSPVMADLSLKARWVALDKWLVTFDSNGGTDVGTQMVDSEVGATATRPADPVREGHTFDGWYASADCAGDPYDFDTELRGNLMLYAKWTCRHAVTFDSAGGSDVGEQTVEHGSTAAAPADPTKPNCTFGGWYATESDPFDFATPVTADLTLTARWYPNDCEVEFDSNGGTAVNGQVVPYGGFVALPENPTRQNHTFDGWYVNLAIESEISDEVAASIQSDLELCPWFWVVKENGAWVVRAEYDPDSDRILGDTTLHARWDAVEHTVGFNANGGENAPATQRVTHGAKAMQPSDEPTRTGYTFTGWYLSERCDQDDLFDFSTTVTADHILYAGWQPDEYFVYFVDYDGVASDVQTVAHGQKVTRPADPTRSAHDGYQFGGWYADEGQTRAYDFDAPVTNDLVIYAKWTPRSYAVSFDANGGNPTPDAQSVLFGGHAHEPEIKPTKEGNTFAGWYVQKTDDVLDADTVDQAPYDSDFDREHWVTDDNHMRVPFSFADTPVRDDLTLHARWLPTSCTVSYDVDNGTPRINDEVVAYGARATQPSVPTKPGCDFAGWWILVEKGIDEELANSIRNDEILSEGYWVTDDSDLYTPFDFTTQEIVENVTLRARWTPREYTVTFVSENGETVAQQKVLSGNKATDIETENWIGLDHIDWYADEGHSKPYDFDAPITQDTTVYGLWNPIICTVTFDSNGGSEVNPKSQEVACEDMATKPDDPVWVGHTFLGWYENVTDQIAPDDLEGYKEWLLQSLSDEKDEDFEGNSAREEYQAISENYLVVDGRTLAKYDPENDPVYHDMTAKALWSKGSLVCEVVIGKGAPKITVDNFEEAGLAAMTQDEIDRGAILRLTVNRVDSADIPDTDKATLADKLAELGATERIWLDIALTKIVAGVETRVESIPVPLKISVELPESIRADGRTYFMLRAHGGEASKIAEGTQDPLVGESGLFSTYLLASKDAEDTTNLNDGGDSKSSGGVANDANRTNRSNGTVASSGTSSTSRTTIPATGDDTPSPFLAIAVTIALAITTLIAAVKVRDW